MVEKSLGVLVFLIYLATGVTDIPLGDTSAGYLAPKTFIHADSKKRGLTAIVADDERMQRRMVKLALEEMGVEPQNIREADNGEAALALFLDQPPDLFITDNQMPRMFGIELIQEVSRLPAKRKNGAVLILRSGSVSGLDDPLALEALASGADGVLPKAVLLNEMGKRIQGILHASRARRHPVDLASSRAVENSL